MERRYDFWKKEIGRKGDGDILFINVWNFSRSKKMEFRLRGKSNPFR